MTKPVLAAVLAVLSLALLPAAAHSAGPMVGGWSTAGVAVGPVRYVTVGNGHTTMLEKIATNGGALEGYVQFRKLLGVPMVALDGTGGGLARDQRTLVLTGLQRGYAHPVSTLYVVSPASMRIRRTITLRGDFAFDAISPDGGTIYLIKLDPRNLTRYSVRALDTATGKLFPKPVVDPREPDEQMRGLPQARVTTPDGRFAYTLYTGGKEPFIHALDTVGRKAACIDLPALPDNAQLGLRLQGRRLGVLVEGTPVAYVDPATRKVTGPGQPATRHAAPSSGGGSSPALWGLLAGAAALALGVAVAVGARRRRATALRS